MNPDCTKKERGETLQDALQSTISNRAKAEHQGKRPGGNAGTVTGEPAAEK